MNILICDDEALARSRLQRLIEKAELGRVIAQAEHGAQALELIEQYSPDVVLMDIQMPVMDGLEVARHLASWQTPPALIFCTAYDEYALAAFEVSAVGYLLKPVRLADLKAALTKLTKINKVQALTLNKQQARSHISVKSHSGVALVPVEHVRLFRADHKYVSVFHRHGELLIDESLKELEDEFSEIFVRVHRNALVNSKAISALEKQDDGSFSLRLHDITESVPVSRRHVAEVRKLLKAL
ncbi:MAG: LytTR family DNA-binding domain-containing protein [Bermanella sp.]